jgi:hypothetical protein
MNVIDVFINTKQLGGMKKNGMERRRLGKKSSLAR